VTDLLAAIFVAVNFNSYHNKTELKKRMTLTANCWLKNLKLWKLSSVQYLYTSYSVWLPGSRDSELTTFFNVFIALRIYLTMPVTVAW